MPDSEFTMHHYSRLTGFEQLERRELPATHLLRALAPDSAALEQQPAALISTQASYSTSAVTVRPTISLSGTNRYVENAPPLVLAPNATFRLGDASLPYGRLVVTIASNASEQDRIALHFPTSAISLQGSYIRYGERIIGHISFITATQLLTQFSAQATPTDVQALLRSITFRTLGDNPSSLTRSIYFCFTDRGGLSSNTALKQVVVQPVNDIPKVIMGGGQTFRAGQGPVVLAPNASISDPDSADFSGGALLVTIARNIQPGDWLSIRNQGAGPGQIGAVDQHLTYGGRLFATYSGGSDGSALSIRFLSEATPAAVKQLLRNITFAASGQPLSTLQRSITFEVSDRLAIETRTYKVVDGHSLSLGIVKPERWQVTDQRPALLFVSGTWTAQGQNWWNERMAYFASRGLVCIRAITRTVAPDSAPEAPAQDIKSAMRWIRSHAAELGIDPGRIGTVGASAGGQLAAVAAMIDGLNDPTDDLSISAKANALMLFNGIVDTGPNGGWGYKRVGERYREFSPAENISADDPPTFDAQGTADRTMPVQTVQRFEQALQAAGVHTDFHYYRDMEHGFMNTAVHNGHYFYWTLLAADRFLASLGWLRGQPTFAQPAADRIASGSSLPWYAGMKTVRVEP